MHACLSKIHWWIHHHTTAGVEIYAKARTHLRWHHHTGHTRKHTHARTHYARVHALCMHTYTQTGRAVDPGCDHTNRSAADKRCLTVKPIKVKLEIRGLRIPNIQGSRQHNGFQWSRVGYDFPNDALYIISSRFTIKRSALHIYLMSTNQSVCMCLFVVCSHPIDKQPTNWKSVIWLVCEIQWRMRAK